MVEICTNRDFTRPSPNGLGIFFPTGQLNMRREAPTTNGIRHLRIGGTASAANQRVYGNGVEIAVSPGEVLTFNVGFSSSGRIARQYLSLQWMNASKGNVGAETTLATINGVAAFNTRATATVTVPAGVQFMMWRFNFVTNGYGTYTGEVITPSIDTTGTDDGPSGWGMEFTNDDRVTQIGDGYSNYQLHARGTVSGGKGAFTFSNIEDPVPVIRVNGTYDVAGVKSLVKSGNSYTCEVRATGSATSIDWFVFGRAKPVSGAAGNRACVEFWDANGVLTFSNEGKAMVVVDQIQYSNVGDALPTDRVYGFFGSFYINESVDVRDDIDSYGNIKYFEVYSYSAEGWIVKPGQRVFAASGTAHVAGHGSVAGEKDTFARSSGFLLVDLTDII